MLKLITNDYISVQKTVSHEIIKFTKTYNKHTLNFYLRVFSSNFLPTYPNNYMKKEGTKYYLSKFKNNFISLIVLRREI